MIFEDLLLKNYLKENGGRITFGNIILEDNHATYSTRKFEVDINIRTKKDGGRNNKDIDHGPAVKLVYNNDLIDIFVKKNKRNDSYYCEIDRNYKNKKTVKELESSKVYKVAQKFILNNAEEIVKIWDTIEGSSDYQDLIDSIKSNNPEFNYDK